MPACIRFQLYFFPVLERIFKQNETIFWRYCVKYTYSLWVSPAVHKGDSGFEKYFVGIKRILNFMQTIA